MPQRPLAIVDLDGVVADVRHRLRHLERRPKDWDAFFDAAPDDPPHPEGLAVVRRLEEDHEVVYLTGRPERCRDDTLAWLDQHGIGGHELLMRSRRDRRPAAQVKVEVLRRRAAGGREPHSGKLTDPALRNMICDKRGGKSAAASRSAATLMRCVRPLAVTREGYRMRSHLSGQTALSRHRSGSCGASAAGPVDPRPPGGPS